MKNLVLLISAIFMVTGLFSCKKDGIKAPAKTNFTGVVSLDGKWDLKTDTVFSAIGARDGGTSYAGKTGDYFNFNTDNKLYIKEGANLDTFNYKILTDSTFTLIAVGAPATTYPYVGSIKATSATSVVITWTEAFFNPGFFYGRTVSLYK
jgi:hypothetical protein